MPDGSEFQTAGTATLKPREAKAVREADNRLVFAERIDSVWKRVEVSRLSGAETLSLTHYNAFRTSAM